MSWFVPFRSLLALTALLTALSVPAAAQRIDWQAYAHPGSGYRIDLPVGLLALRGEVDGRLVYETADGQARLVTYSVDNGSRASLARIAADLAAADAIERVTYRREGRSWVVLSGYYRPGEDQREASIFYLKLMMSADRSRYAVFAISYPPSAKRAFDPIVARLESSFRPPA